MHDCWFSNSIEQVISFGILLMYKICRNKSSTMQIVSSFSHQDAHPQHMIVDCWFSNRETKKVNTISV